MINPPYQESSAHRADRRQTSQRGRHYDAPLESGKHILTLLSKCPAPNPYDAELKARKYWCDTYGHAAEVRSRGGVQWL